MAYTLTKGAAVKVVSTDTQRDNLINLGWTLQGGGSASDTPYDVHDFSNPTPQDFKGIGLSGENPNSIAYTAKKLTQGADKETYAGLVDIMHKHGEQLIPDGYTVDTVAALPASGEDKKVYLLTHKDATTGLKPGAYTYTDGKWAEFTV